MLGRKVNEIRVSIQGETRIRGANGAGQPTINFDAGLTVTPTPSVNGIICQSLVTMAKLQAADNFSYSFGKHDVKFGGDVDAFVVRKNTFAGWRTGQFNFARSRFVYAGAPYALHPGFSANWTQPCSATAGPNFPSYQTAMGLYLQDKWAVTPRLTVTYGIRWDLTWNPQPQTPFPGVTY